MEDILKNSVLLNSGRNCLRFITRIYNIKQIKIPFYICPVVWQSLQEEGVKIKFYHIGRNFMPLEKFCQDEYVLYPNYFGICDKQCEILSAQYKNLIIDNAQALFAKPQGLCGFYSPRKFLNVNDGGILYISKGINFALYKDNFVIDADRNQSIKNYDEYLQNELSIDNQPIKKMSEKTYKTLVNTDLKNEQEKRKEIFKQIHNIVGKYNLFKVNLDEYCSKAMFYPLLTDEAGKYAELLQKNGVYIIRYWSKLPNKFPESIFFEKLLAIPLKNEVIKILS